jgi:hypothetical protein
MQILDTDLRSHYDALMFERAERIGVALDLENLLHGFRRRGALSLGLGRLVNALQGYASRGVLVWGIACCDRSLQRQVAFELAEVPVRVFGHEDRTANAADREILAYLAHDLPQSVSTVVIGSGDRIFVSVARGLRSQGRRVEVLASRTALSEELARVAHDVALLEKYAPRGPIPADRRLVAA